MAQLRSGARRSKRLGDLQQPAAQPVEQAEKVGAPAQTERKKENWWGKRKRKG
ncbi:hypothetical protein Hanom_Chr06g00497121 [Helianthus anomalus]